MPLSKAKDRERKRLKKFQPNSNLNTKPQFQPKLEDLRELVKHIEAGGHTSVQPVSNLTIPWYNPRVHKQ